MQRNESLLLLCVIILSSDLFILSLYVLHELLLVVRVQKGLDHNYSP